MVIDEGIKKLIEENALALSSVDASGNPHNIAVAYCKVVGGDKVIITNTQINETIVNLEHNKKVSLAVWHKDWEDVCVGFELKGEAVNETEGRWLEFVKSLPDNEGYDIKSAIVVTVDYIKKLLS